MSSVVAKAGTRNSPRFSRRPAAPHAADGTTPDRVSFGHTAILRPLIGRAGPTTLIVPTAVGAVDGERKVVRGRPVARRVRCGQLP